MPGLQRQPREQAKQNPRLCPSSSAKERSVPRLSEVGKAGERREVGVLQEAEAHDGALRLFGSGPPRKARPASSQSPSKHAHTPVRPEGQDAALQKPVQHAAQRRRPRRFRRGTVFAAAIGIGLPASPQLVERDAVAASAASLVSP